MKKREEVLEEIPALAVWWHLARSFSLITRVGDRLLAQFGLTGPQLGVLRCIEDAGGSLHLGQIGEQMLVTCGNVTGVVDRLERAGYVVRERTDEDRRVVLARMTPEGQALCARATAALVEHFAALLDFMTPEEHRALAGQLERIHLNLKEGIS